MHFTDTEVEAISIKLRDVNNRANFPRNDILQILKQLMETQANNNEMVNSKILCLKVITNYVSDIPENSEFIYELIKNRIPNISCKSLINIDYNLVNLFIKIQLILLNNIIITKKDIIKEQEALNILDNIFYVFTMVESEGIEIDSELIIDIIDELYDVVKGIELSRFLILRKMLLTFKETSLSEGNIENVEKFYEIINKYSVDLKIDLKEDELIEVFFELLEDTTEYNDEKIFLNLSYEMNLNSVRFLKLFLDYLFDKNGELKNLQQLPMFLIILSNCIISEENKNIIFNRISTKTLINEYFNKVYPKLTMQKMYELQSIVFFNKIPDTLIKIEYESLISYMNKLSSLLNPSLIQINKELVNLQIKFLGKLLLSFVDNERLENVVIEFLYNLRISNEYNKFPNEFKQNFNMIVYPYLSHIKDDDQFMNKNGTNKRKFLEGIIYESNEILNDCIKNKEKIEFKYLIELSKIYGFYSNLYKNEKWFTDEFQKYEELVLASSANKDVNILNKGEQQAWTLLSNNIKYTATIISNNNNV